MSAVLEWPELTRRQMVVLGAILAGTAATTMPFLLAGVLALQLKSALGLTDPQFGLALGAFFASSGVCSLVGGRIADREGWSRTLVWGLSLNVAVQLTIAVFVQPFGGLLAATLLAGGHSP